MNQEKTNLELKYKDRSPEQTINIIKNFFESHNFNLEEEICACSEASTYWCHIVLFYNGYKILETNGKGSNKIYSLASGYSELYERFCGGVCSINLDFFDRKKYQELNYQKHGYYLSKDEKFDSFENVKNCCEKYKKFLSFFCDEEDYLLKTIALITPEQEDLKLLTVPYINFNDITKVKYFNEYLMNVMQGSDGWAAGNSLEEALTQGLSECYEHYVGEQIYTNTPNLFYELNLASLELPEYLKEIVYNIKLNNNLYIYDLSYNFQVPVLMSILVNKVTHKWHMNLGSSPIFEIALERILTELYQGVFHFDIYEEDKFLLPSRNVSYADAMATNIGDMSCRTIYPESIALNRIVIDNFNTDIFLKHRDYSNKELNEYLQVINKKNNFNVYYRNLSLISDMFAVRVFIEDIPLFDITTYQKFSQISNSIQQEIFKYQYLILREYNNFLNINTKQYSLDNLLTYLKVFNKYKKEIINNEDYIDILFSSSKFKFLFIDITNLDDFFHEFSKRINVNLLLKYSYNNINYKINLYYPLYKFIKNGCYTDKELEYFFKFLNYPSSFIKEKISIIKNKKNEIIFKELILDFLKIINESNEYINFISIYI